MRLAVGGIRGELGRVLSSHVRDRGHEVVAAGPVQAYIDVANQHRNSLLSDGNAWNGFVNRAGTGTQRRLQEARARQAGVFIYASFAFLRGIEDPDRIDDPMRSIARTALAVEEMVLAAPMPSCVVRLGYLYGPWMKDLRGYRTAFRLGRPYWSGPAEQLQDNLHQLDACSALVAAARPPRASRFYATDGQPVGFREFMDHFARLIGNPVPLHMGGAFKLTARLVIRPEHMQAVQLSMPAGPPRPMTPAWKPRYPDYRDGLRQVVEEWARG